MAKRKQITITLPNKPGELAQLCKRLAKKKVNIEALSVSNLLDVGVVRIVPSNIKQAKSALNNMGVTIAIDDVVAVQLPNRVGALADASSKLLKKKINIDYVYGSCCGCKGSCKCKAVCIFKTSNLSETDKLLK